VLLECGHVDSRSNQATNTRVHASQSQLSYS
jgi:hypothetical protein